MSVGFLAPQTFVLPVSGALRLFFTNMSAPWASFQLLRQSGSQDASFRVFTSNFSGKDVPGYATPYEVAITGSTAGANYGYWYAEPGASGSAFTGSATDAPSPYVMHFADVVSKHLMVEVSSSKGGTFILAPHLKMS